MDAPMYAESVPATITSALATLNARTITSAAAWKDTPHTANAGQE